jgi:muconolactone delta-isomerase
VLRLWRPPLAPGEWRTLGLFAAADAAGLDRVLASMPLRIWRSDEVTELAPHANDPAASAWYCPPPGNGETAAEFLVAFTAAVPPGTPAQDVEDAAAGEAGRASELARQGHLVRLWALPAGSGASSALGLWRARGGPELQAILASLPLAPYQATRATPLTPHPSDPAAPGSKAPRVTCGSRERVSR